MIRMNVSSRECLLIVRIVLEPYHQVPYVGHESEGLPEDEHRILPDDSVGYDHAGTDQADDPEAAREHALMAVPGVGPLVDESQSEYDLSGRAEDDQPERNLLIAEEVGDKGLGIPEQKYQSHGRGYQE